MRIDIDIPSGDYRSTAFLAERSLGEGDFSLKRQLVALTGNVATVDIGVYVAASKTAIGSFTAAVRAAGEIDRVAALVTAADPAPDRNVIGTPIPCATKAGESLYLYLMTGDAAVSGTVSLFF